jgi:hypothetical protein
MVGAADHPSAVTFRVGTVGGEEVFVGVKELLRGRILPC